MVFEMTKLGTITKSIFLFSSGFSLFISFGCQISSTVCVPVFVLLMFVFMA